MFSKIVLTPLLIASILLNLSCASENEPIPKVKVIDAGMQKAGSVKSELFCLSEFSQYIVNYFWAKMNRQDLENFWNCTAMAIAVFKSYAKPNEKGLYPAKHVRNFLTEYFWPKEHFSDDFLKELMYLKQVLFGGEADSFSLQDFDRMQSFLSQDMKQLTVSLVDEIPTLTSGIVNDKKENLTEEQMNRAVFKFRKVMREFGFAFSRHGYSYPFQRIQKLLLGLKPLLTDETDNDSLFARLEVFVPIIQETKVLLVGPDREKILSTEWGDFFVLIANAYSIWLRSENFIVGKNFTKGAALSQLYMLVDEILTYIQAGISKRLVQVYTHKEARQWLKAMDDVFGIPFGVQHKLIEKYWSWLIDKVFVSDLEAKNIEGLTPHKVAFVRETFYGLV